MTYLLHHILTRSAEKYPGNVAVTFNDSSMTYAELDRESSKLAGYLSATGVQSGDRVGIYLNRSISSVVGLFGILKAGATYVPVDPTCPPSRLGYIMKTCEFRSLLSSGEKLDTIRKVLPENPTLESVIIMHGQARGAGLDSSCKLVDWPATSASVPSVAPEPGTVDGDLAYILFTSGSTGIPKGVMLSHLNAMTFINSAHDFFEIRSNDRFSNICPLHFDMSVVDLFVAFRGGATVVIIPETVVSFPAKLAEVIAKHGITVWNSVPSALSLLATYGMLGSHDLSSLRLVLFAGEQFPLKYLRRLQEAVPGARFCNMYGQTEANSSTYYWVDDLPPDSTAPLPIGRTMPNFGLFALGEDGRKITTPGEEGELYVRGSTVALGYWGDSERTEKAFVMNPLRPGLNERVYRTGDLVCFDENGNYVFLGRKDQMIKSRGYKIEIGEIEAALAGHPDIKSAVVIPIPDELIGNRLSLFVVPMAHVRLGKREIASYCSERLPKYMVPEIIEFRDALPSTSSGKVDRKLLSDQMRI